MKHQQVLIAILPKFGAVLSLVGSSSIIGEVMAERRKRKITAPSRILVAMSVSDISFSIGWFLSTWPAPRDTSHNKWQPLGNTQTCSLQGFIIQVGWVATPMFNFSLTLIYMLMVRYNWREKQLSRLEPFFYALIWSFAVGSAILGVVLKLFNSFSTAICWFDSLPQQCYLDPNIECIRGQNSHKWAIFFQFVPIWPCIISSACCLGMIYASVRNIERRNTSYFGNQISRGASTRRSEAVGWQALWYIGAFLVAFLPDQVATMLYLVGKGNFYVDLAAVALLPAQGFFNFIVFLRSRDDLTSASALLLRRTLCWCRGNGQGRGCCARKNKNTSNNPRATLNRNRDEGRMPTLPESTDNGSEQARFDHGAKGTALSALATPDHIHTQKKEPTSVSESTMATKYSVRYQDVHDEERDTNSLNSCDSSQVSSEEKDSQEAATRENDATAERIESPQIQGV